MATADVLLLIGEDVFFDALEDDKEVQNLIESAEEAFLLFLDLSGLF